MAAPPSMAVPAVLQKGQRLILFYIFKILFLGRTAMSLFFPTKNVIRRSPFIVDMVYFDGFLNPDVELTLSVLLCNFVNTQVTAVSSIVTMAFQRVSRYQTPVCQHA